MSLFSTLLKLFLAALICIAVIQISAVYVLKFMQSDLTPADLVVVLPGSKERISYGCMVAAEQDAGHLMLINSSPKAVKQHLARYDVPESVDIIPGGTSRSSFEDIYTMMEAVRKNNIDSIILVTSDYHLPRTLFLIHVYSRAVGKDLDIQYMPTVRKTFPALRYLTFYNEAIKFWGSFVEMSGYLITSRLPLDSDRVMSIRNIFKNALLFRV